MLVLVDSQLVMIIAGSAALAVAVAGVVLYYEKRLALQRKRYMQLSEDCARKMIQTTLESQENERKRVAADLHDDVGASLAAARLGLGVLASQNPSLGSRLGNVIQLIDNTMGSVRRISHGLMPATLERFGLRQALLELCDQLSSVSDLPVQFEDEGTPFQLGYRREILVYRIVQELVQNAIKHAGVGPIVIRMNWDQQLTLEVVDQGSGFDATLKSSNSGIGIYNIESRARLLGGRLKYGRHRPSGTKVQLCVPVE